MYEKNVLEKRIVEFLRNEDTPTNISWIAANTAISFCTCKKFLKHLVENQKIVAVETSRCTLFSI